jgi:hypothetical protein
MHTLQMVIKDERATSTVSHPLDDSAVCLYGAPLVVQIRNLIFCSLLRFRIFLNILKGPSHKFVIGLK